MMRRRFQQVDVFGTEPFSGNPLAVVLDADGLSEEQMQAIAHWTNLSETTFILPPTTPDADYRVRIFTPAQELPFAGHPTLGSCHSWLSAGGVPHDSAAIVQECLAGKVAIRRDGGQLAFAAPSLVRSGPVEDGFVTELAAILGISRSEIVDAQWVDNGPGWVGLLLPDVETVLAVEADASRFTGSGNLDIGLVGIYPPGSECAVEVRALMTDERKAICEDPVTGSLNASIAQWLLSTGRLTKPYVASQGTRLGRRGRVRITQDNSGAIWVGGRTVSHITGEIEI